MNQPNALSSLPQRPPSTAAWPYRCFYIRAAAGGWRATNCLAFIQADFPREFIWTSREDREGLRTYIDLITAGRRAEAIDFEDRKLVHSIQYDPMPVEGTVKVTLERFLDFITMRGHIDVPLKHKVQFVGNRGRQLVPAEFITSLMKYVPNPKWFGDPSDWHWVKRDELDEIDPAGLTVSSGMYRGMPNAVDNPEDVAAMEADGVGSQVVPSIRRYRRRQVSKPPRETEIERVAHERYFELLTVATPSHGPQYFVRRLSTYAGEMLWSGTSYNLSGPWAEHERNSGMLLALGVNV